MNRRRFLQKLLNYSALAGLAVLLRPAFAAEKFEIEKSPEEWKKILSPQQFHVLREHGTEAPHSSPLDKEHRKGTYSCAACELPLFSSKAKFDSGTGWPSFYEPLPNAVGTDTDYKLMVPRTEIHCRRCGGHLGHVFDDGPKPTGKRYCMNGVALKFTPDA
ncbi:MAG: peptide-methionine (R)-S-oxide reductase MsrB [Bdellovibrionales bacterium]